MSDICFSVIIPLYNKKDEIAQTISSILAQTCPPIEVIVVDDGSTDGGGAIVKQFGSPLVKLIHQPNGGECAARNRAIAEATGNYMALLDADDYWEPGYLAEIKRLIETYPDCGLYCTAFNIVSAEGIFPSRSPETEGIVEDFYRESIAQYVAIPSASTIRADVFEKVGGFPEGMKLGGDQYMWVKIADEYRFCYSPARLLNYSVVAANRSASSYKPEQTPYSFQSLYDPTGDFYRNEYIARVDLGKAWTIAGKGDITYGKEAEKFYRYTRLSKKLWWRLWLLNRIPVRWRSGFVGWYSDLAWKILKRGL